MKVTIALSAAATALALTGAAYAQSPGQPWNADQLSSSLVGKQIEHIRSSDGRKFVWDVRKGGTVFIKNTSLKGKWRVQPDGAFCVDWASTQVAARCYLFHGSPQDARVSYSTAPGEVTSTAKVLD